MSNGIAVLAPGCADETDLIATVGPLFNLSVVSYIVLMKLCIENKDILFRSLTDSQISQAAGIRTITACSPRRSNWVKDLPG